MAYDPERLQPDLAQVCHEDAGFGTGRLVADNLVWAAHTPCHPETGVALVLNDWKVWLAQDRAVRVYRAGSVAIKLPSAERPLADVEAMLKVL